MQSKTNGFTLIESIFSLALFALISAGVFGALLYGGESSILSVKRQRALFIVDEGIEAVRNIRDDEWSLITAGTHGLSNGGSVWSFSGLSDSVSEFMRAIDIADIDSKRKSVVSSITWQQSPSRVGDLSIETRITNWRAPRIGNWALPVREAGLNISGTSDGLKIVHAGDYAYFVRNGGSPDLFTVNVSNPSSPEVVSSLDVAGTASNIALSGGRLYVSSRDNGAELQIFDISNPASPSALGSYNAPGNADALGLADGGTHVFLLRASDALYEFSVIDVSNPASPAGIGFLDVGASLFEAVSAPGAYAYVASGHDSREFLVIDIKTPSAPALVGQINFSGTTDARTVSGFEGGALLGRSTSLHIVTTANPLLPAVVGTAAIGGTVNDVVSGNLDSYAFLASAATQEYKTVDFFTLGAPTILGSYDVAGGSPLNGVAYDEVRDRVYAVGSSNSEEFVVIAPTPF